MVRKAITTKAMASNATLTPMPAAAPWLSPLDEADLIAVTLGDEVGEAVVCEVGWRVVVTVCVGAKDVAAVVMLTYWESTCEPNELLVLEACQRRK